MSWVPLHVHSQFSILDASASISAICRKAEEFKMEAVALTDHGNLYGAVDFFKACKNVKPIIGCEVYVAPQSRKEKTKGLAGKTAYHLVLLAKDSQGYRNLCYLSSEGFLSGFYYNPRIDKELLKKHCKGLICLSGCLSGSVALTALHGSYEELLNEVRFYQELFGDDYYLELQRHQMSDAMILADGLDQEGWLYQNYLDFIAKQEKVNGLLIQAARDLNIKLVATNDSHYIERLDWKAHEILLNVQSGEPCEVWERDSLGNPKVLIPNPKRRVYATHELYFKSPQEMEALFQDIPEAIHNTLEVARKCSLELDFKTKHYPIFVPPSLQNRSFSKEEQVAAASEFLMQLCLEGIEKRYTPQVLAKVAAIYPGQDPKFIVQERLKMEMDLITSKGMCDYLLIVYDFINWAKKNQIPMGPGRGSGAGSIILYLIAITDIEPLRFNLFFERFINPERLSYPDIDVDICMDRRSEVLEYTLEKYGKENVAQIITFGTMKAKMAIKDVGRVLSVPLSKVNIIAGLVPEDPNMTLDRALETDPELHTLYNEDPQARRIIDLAKCLEGSIRNTGIHAAGIIICGDPLAQHIPICNAKDSDMAVTQYSMKPVELVGMLKIDFLGLKTLTCIQKTVDTIKKRFDVAIDWTNLTLEDPKTFELLNQGQTLGVFQLESGGMRELSKQLHIDKFEEIIAVGSLYRPGPMEMIPSFINRKHGRENIESDHPWMKDILDETYGIMVYQEQVMQIAVKLAGYSLGEGDVLRRAMGKKDMAEMARQREKFRSGAAKNGIDQITADKVFDKMEKFASYGFNKSHAAAYAYLSYVTAYLKANFPMEWMASLMTCDRDDLSKVAKFIREAEMMNIKILPPDVNEADVEFMPTQVGVRFAMSGIKGVGEGVVQTIIDERNRKGPFRDLWDFLKRVDVKKVGRKVIEQLIDAGSFDFTSWSRDGLKLGLETMYDVALTEQKEAASGVMNFFNLLQQNDQNPMEQQPIVKVKRSQMDLLIKEKELLGFFLTGHPMDGYRDIIKQLSCISLQDIEEMDDGSIFRTALLVETVQTRISAKNGKKFAITIVSDGVERYELPIWPDLYEEKAELLKENKLLYAVLQIERKDSILKLSCRWLADLAKADQTMIEQCDKAYDLAKMMAAKSQAKASLKKDEVSRTPTKKNNGKNQPVKTMTNEELKIIVDADQVKLSDILALKKIFRKHQGPHPITIEFACKQKELPQIYIDNPWGVKQSPQLLQEIKEILAVVKAV